MPSKKGSEVELIIVDEDDDNDPNSIVLKTCIEFIPCDACGTSNPQYRCSTCHLTFYCDASCGQNHWQVHKAHCKSHDEIRKQFLEGIISTNPSNKNTSKATNDDDDNNKEKTNKQCCQICEKTNENDPNLLLISSSSLFDDCISNHQFCFTCLLQYHQYAPPKTTKQALCPICVITNSNTKEDGTDQDEEEQRSSKEKQSMMMTRAAINMSIAAQCHTTAKRNKYCQMALDDIEYIQDKDPNNVAAKLLYAEVLNLLQKYDLALELLQDTLTKFKSGQVQESAQTKIQQYMEQVKTFMMEGNSKGAELILDQIEQIRNQKYSISIAPTDVIDLTLQIGQIQQNMEDYGGAIRTYQKLIEKYSNEHDISPTQYLQLYINSCRCLYHRKQQQPHQQNYDLAIEMGMTAIEMNRHYPQVHTYVIKSWIGKGGDLNQAYVLACRALMYETPWDDTNKQQNQKLYNEIQDMMNS